MSVENYECRECENICRIKITPTVGRARVEYAFRGTRSCLHPHGRDAVWARVRKGEK